MKANFALCQKTLFRSFSRTQVNYIIDGYGLLYLVRYKQKVSPINGLKSLILSDSVILCKRGELNLCKNKTTFDFCNIYFPC